MPTIQYPKNPNVDTAFVTDDQGNRTRAIKTAPIDGTIDYPKNSNSTDCYVTVDGKKQRALMTADVSSAGTLEYPTNSNSTKGYVTVGGKKQRVILTASLTGGGSTINNQDITVTSNGIYTADEGYTGLGTVDVNVPNPSTGTITITSNGTYDVTDKATADVQVPTTAPALYRVFRDNNGVLENSISTPWVPLPSTVHNLGAYVLYSAYRATPSNVLSGAIDLSMLTVLNNSLSLSECFASCPGITSVDMSALTTIGGANACQYMFQDCTGLTSANLSALTTVSGASACGTMFSSCTGLTGIDLSSLTTLSGSNSCYYMFNGCTGLTSADLSSLTTVSGNSACYYMFAGCPNLTSLSFPSITPNSFGTRTNQFNVMCYIIPNITLHFPSNTQAKIETLASYSATAPFGATSGTVLFDLPATYTLTGADSNTYSRNPKYDTATSLAWKVGAYGTTNFTPAYYTSGTTDPSVSDAIYSDAACTQSVTTITAIA